LAARRRSRQRRTKRRGKRPLRPWPADSRGHRGEDRSLNDTWEACQMKTAHSMNTGSECRSAERAIQSAAVKGAIGTRAKTAKSDKTLRRLVRWCPCPAGDHLLLQGVCRWAGSCATSHPPGRHARAEVDTHNLLTLSTKEKRLCVRRFKGRSVGPSQDRKPRLPWARRSFEVSQASILGYPGREQSQS